MSNLEIRNPKQLQNPNFLMFKTMLNKTEIRIFDHLNFENLKIVSDFDIRISDFL